MATQVFLRAANIAACDAWGSGDAGWNPNSAFRSSGYIVNEVSAVRLDRGASVLTATGSGVSSSTERIRLVSGSGSLYPQHWVTPPIDRDVTISGTVTFNLWMSESAMTTNAQAGCYVARIGPTGTLSAAIADSTVGVELGTALAANNWTQAPTSLAVNKGDRLLIVPYFTNIGTMGTGTVTLTTNGGTAGASGDSYVTFTEDFDFITGGLTPTFRAATIQYNASASTISITDPPAGTQQNDIMVMVVCNPTNATPTLPSGWAWVVNQTSSVTNELGFAGIAWKRAGASEAGPYDVTSCATGASGAICGYFNGDTSSTPFESSTDSRANSSGATGTGTGITTANDSSMVLGADCAYDYSTSRNWTAESITDGAMTERLDVTNTVTIRTNLMLAERAKPTAGTTGAFATTISSAQENIALLCALKSSLPNYFSGSTIYPTTTASQVDPNGASYDAKEAWTSRGSGVTTTVTNTSATPASPLLATVSAGGNFAEWFTRALQAFTLGGAVLVNLRALESNIAANATVGLELAVCNNDGTSPVVWGYTLYGVEVTTSEAAYQLFVSGDDVAIAAGQRLRVRLFTDDSSGEAMATSHTVTMHYAGTSGGASGDCYLTFPLTLMEASGAGAPLLQHLPFIPRGRNL